MYQPICSGSFPNSNLSHGKLWLRINKNKYSHELSSIPRQLSDKFSRESHLAEKRSHKLEMKSRASAVLLVTVVFAFSGRSLAEGRVGEACRISNFQGKCKVPKDCESFRMDDPVEIEKFRSTHCGFLKDLVTMVICCPETSTIPVAQNLAVPGLPASQIACNKLEARNKRKPRSLDDYIIKGVNASDNEFPQFAALAYKKNDVATLRFGCGGVLISENFVLTAAHCLKKEDPVRFVRLGTIHLNNEKWKTDVNVKVSGC